jgi:hypothetical protein
MLDSLEPLLNINEPDNSVINCCDMYALLF